MTTLESEYTVRVRGADIFTTDTGGGDAPAVVLLHGGGPGGASGLSNYSRNIEALARNFRVVVPDMPGTAGPASTSTMTTRSAFWPTGCAAFSTN